MSKIFLLFVPALLAAAILSACGGDENLAGNEADASFVADMIPHHQGAVVMAKMAKQRADHPELEAMAGEIIAAQEKEISEMRALQAELPEVETGDGDSMMMGEDHMGHTGLDAEAMGMDMDPSELKTADSFDLAFIGMMIPHHEGAVEMAKRLLEEGQNAQLQKMARAVVASQTAEIRTMRAWRDAWSGKRAETESGVEG